jgi:hypothetical protein
VVAEVGQQPELQAMTTMFRTECALWLNPATW